MLTQEQRAHVQRRSTAPSAQFTKRMSSKQVQIFLNCSTLWRNSQLLFFFFFIIMPDLLALFWLINLPSLPPSSTRRKKEHYTIITSSFYAPFNFFFSGFFSNLYRCFPPWQAGVSSQNAISSIGALSVLAFFFFSRHPLLKRYEFHVNMVLSACALADEK